MHKTSIERSMENESFDGEMNNDIDLTDVRFRNHIKTI